jgi:hypothetical protein
MKTSFVSIALVIGALFAASAYAAPPAGAIAECKDGTYFTGTAHKGACKGHKGVKTWLDTPAASATTAAPATDTAKKTKKQKKADAAAASAATAGTAPETARKTKKQQKADAAAAAAAATPAPAPAPAPKPATAAPPATAPAPSPSAAAKHPPPTPASQLQQKPGGGPGLVWVNSGSKVYHCQDDEWYGKTKEGSYMTEAAAKAAGNHGARGKECTK